MTAAHHLTIISQRPSQWCDGARRAPPPVLVRGRGLAPPPRAPMPPLLLRRAAPPRARRRGGRQPRGACARLRLQNKTRRAFLARTLLPLLLLLPRARPARPAAHVIRPQERLQLHLSSVEGGRLRAGGETGGGRAAVAAGNRWRLPSAHSSAAASGALARAGAAAASRASPGRGGGGSSCLVGLRRSERSRGFALAWTASLARSLVRTQQDAPTCRKTHQLRKTVARAATPVRHALPLTNSTPTSPLRRLFPPPPPPLLFPLPLPAAGPLQPV